MTNKEQALGELQATLEHANAFADILRKDECVNWYRMLPIIEALRDMVDHYRMPGEQKFTTIAKP